MIFRKLPPSKEIGHITFWSPYFYLLFDLALLYAISWKTLDIAQTVIVFSKLSGFVFDSKENTIAKSHDATVLALFL